MSVIVEIADAVAAAINDGTYAEPVTAERAYRPSFDLEELGELKVTVVPRSVNTANLARQQSQVDCTVDVGLQQRVDAGDDARLDALLDLAEEIGDQLRHKRLAGYPQAAWVDLSP
jgi:hypothetical protein